MSALSPELSETVALEALGWLVRNEALLPVFLGSSGASLADVKAGAGEASFQASVLDFVLMDDAWVTECAAAIDRAPEMLMRARACLPGAEQVNWT